MTIEHPVSDWKKMMEELDIQTHYDRTFAAMWAITFQLTLPSWVCDYSLPKMMNQFIPKQSDIDFLTNIYLPELKKVTKNVHVGFF